MGIEKALEAMNAVREGFRPAQTEHTPQSAYARGQVSQDYDEVKALAQYLRSIGSIGTAANLENRLPGLQQTQRAIPKFDPNKAHSPPSQNGNGVTTRVVPLTSANAVPAVQPPMAATPIPVMQPLSNEEVEKMLAQATDIDTAKMVIATLEFRGRAKDAHDLKVKFGLVKEEKDPVTEVVR
jgi:hypothetical protein